MASPRLAPGSASSQPPAQYGLFVCRYSSGGDRVRYSPSPGGVREGMARGRSMPLPHTRPEGCAGNTIGATALPSSAYLAKAGW